MSAIIALIIAVLFALWGYNKRLYPAWAFAFNVIIASYLGLMLTPAVLGWKLAGGLVNILGPYANVVIMITITALYLAISQILSKFYLTNTYCISFPRWVDNIGGAVLGFIGGYIIANFILYALASSPLKTDTIFKKFIPSNTGNTLVGTCRFVSSLSLQYGDGNISKAARVVNVPVVAEPQTIKKSTDSNQTAPIIETLQKRDEIPDLNEQTEQ